MGVGRAAQGESAAESFPPPRIWVTGSRTYQVYIYRICQDTQGIVMAIQHSCSFRCQGSLGLDCLTLQRPKSTLNVSRGISYFIKIFCPVSQTFGVSCCGLKQVVLKYKDRISQRTKQGVSGPNPKGSGIAKASGNWGH